jgi:hypothetical protein
MAAYTHNPFRCWLEGEHAVGKSWAEDVDFGQSAINPTVDGGHCHALGEKLFQGAFTAHDMAKFHEDKVVFEQRLAFIDRLHTMMSNIAIVFKRLRARLTRYS